MVIYVIYYIVMILSKNNNLLENKARINTTFYHFENQSIAVIIPALCLGKIKCKHQISIIHSLINFCEKLSKNDFLHFFFKNWPYFSKEDRFTLSVCFFLILRFLSPLAWKVGLKCPLDIFEYRKIEIHVKGNGGHWRWF